jgi:hypothetical protein
MSVTIEPIEVYINQFIQNYAFLDAVFLAERLCAEGKQHSTESLDATRLPRSF